MILITLFMSLSVLSAENPDNTSTNQINAQDLNNNELDQSTISTNINKEVKQSSNSIKNYDNENTSHIISNNNNLKIKQNQDILENNKNSTEKENTGKYNIESNTTKNIKTATKQNKTYTISNYTQLNSTLHNIVENQSEDYNYILNLEDGTYRFSENLLEFNFNTTKKLNVTIKGSSYNTLLDQPFFDITSSVTLNISNVKIISPLIQNRGTCILDNIYLPLQDILGRGDEIFNSGKLVIINSNLSIRNPKGQGRWFSTDTSGNVNTDDYFNFHVTGGIKNNGFLEIENTTFNNSYTSEETRYYLGNIYDYSIHSSGECDAKGGIIFNNGTVKINNTRFLNTNLTAKTMPSYAYGGSIYNMGNMTISNTTFENNRLESQGGSYTYWWAPGTYYGKSYGGAIYNDGNLNITQSIFSNMTILNADNDYVDTKGLAIYNNRTLHISKSAFSKKSNDTVVLIYSENNNSYVEDNIWWSSNTPQWNELLSNVDAPEKWIYLKTQIDTDKLNSTQTTKINYDFNYLTDGNTITQSTGNMPDNTIVSGKVSLGSISENKTKDGYAQTTYTAVNKGLENITLTVEENEITQLNLTINPIDTHIIITNLTENISLNENLKIKANIVDANNKPVTTGIIILKIDGITQKNNNKTNVEIPVQNGTITYQMKIDNKFGIKLHNLTLKYMSNSQYVESTQNAIFNLSKPTYPIKNVSGYEALINAINNFKKQTLNPYSIVTVNLTRGDYNLTQLINWGNATYKTLRIYGNGNLIDANNKQFITVDPGYTLELYNFKIRYATAERGSVIYNNHGTINIYDSIFLNCTATKNGGVIYNDHGKVKILNSSFSNNKAENGAVIYNNNGFVNETKSYFSFNTANRGGVNYNIGETIIVKSTYKNNNAKINGGVNFNDKNKLTINNSNFINNKALNYGGVNYNNKNAKLNITSSQMTNNKALNGGVNANYGSMTIKSSNLNQNNATRGGVNYNYKDLEIIKSTFKNNNAINNAAVNYNDHGNININDSTFKENKANRDGGVNYNNNGNITINNTKNMYNIANRGSVNYNLKSILTIENTNSTTKSSSINYNEKGIIKNRNTYETEQ